MTAVDPSEQLLDEARERWPKILWIQADVQALPAELRRGRFDLVYSPEGVLARVTDLDALGARASPARCTPAASCSSTTTIRSRSASTRSSAGSTTTSRRGFWRLGKIVTALARAGFHVEALEEYPGERRLPGTFLSLRAARR